MHISDIALSLSLDIVGNTSLKINHFVPVEDSQSDSIIFIEEPNKFKQALSTGSAFLIPESHRKHISIDNHKAYLFSSVPRLSFIKLLNLFDPYKHLEPPKINTSPESTIHQSVKMGANVIVSKAAVIEEGVIFRGNNFIGEGCLIKKNTLIEAGAVILHGCEVGEHCIIGANSSIGGEGFGYEKTKQGLVKIPQIGRVVLEDQVEVGSNVCIDRATLGDTRIGFNTKIDNLVQIGHNVKIGANCVIVSQVGIAGSSELGRGVVLAGQVGIADHVSIGDESQLGARTGVHSGQILPSNRTFLGDPAIGYRDELRARVAIRKLPELLKKIEEK